MKAAPTCGNRRGPETQKGNQHMSTLTPFTYEGQEVRVIDIDSEPWFVLADLCAVLAIGNSRMAAKRLDEADVSQADISSSGQRRSMTVVSEPGMYEVVVRSDSPAARPFRRWVTHEVLPAIRRTGQYSAAPQLSGKELLAAAVLEAAETIKRHEETIADQRAELEVARPKAHTWDAICSGRGDYTITEAAKILTSAGIQTGPRKLHAQLQQLGWMHRNQRGKWAANQDRLNAGLPAEKARHYIDDDGVSTLATPQVRVTPKGMQKLRELLATDRAQGVLA